MGVNGEGFECVGNGNGKKPFVVASQASHRTGHKKGEKEKEKSQVLDINLTIANFAETVDWKPYCHWARMNRVFIRRNMLVRCKKNGMLVGMYMV